MTIGEPRDPPASLRMDAADAQKPLPPLPDGGLQASMPEWLRSAPQTGQATTLEHAPAADPDTIDLRSFLSADDLPEWVRRLAAERERQPSAPNSSTIAAGAPPAPRPVDFPRRFPRDRPVLPSDAPRALHDKPTGVNRPPSHSELILATRSGPSLLWPLLLFGVVTALLVVAFLIF